MITSHILNISTGKPADGVEAVLFFQENNDPIAIGWKEIAKSKTNSDGRITEWLSKEPAAGVYKIRFETKKYFDKNSIATFYPYVEIVFEIRSNEHYHIPLLLSPFGYSTYRGS
jgi:5-hydroxyisourate hydrolase